MSADLVKRYGDTTALAGLDLSIARGELFGILGPNGAGKTTLVRVLATLLRPDARRGRVLGHDVVAAGDGGAPADRAGRASSPPWTSCSPAARTCACSVACSTCRAGRPARRADELLERFDLVGRRRPQRAHLLRRHAPAPGPGLRPADPPAGAVPRRAHHRPGPAQPQPDLDGGARAQGPGHHRAAHHPVPGGGRPAGRPHRGHRPRPGDRRGHGRRAQGPDRRPDARGSPVQRRRPRASRARAQRGRMRRAPRRGQRGAGGGARAARRGGDGGRGGARPSAAPRSRSATSACVAPRWTTCSWS